MYNSLKSTKAGWINISIISRFKRVKVLTHDVIFLANSLRESSKLEVSEDGTRVRRKFPLPDWDSSVYYRTIFISSLREDAVPSIDSMTKIFAVSKLLIVMIRIIGPGRKIPRHLVKSIEFKKQFNQECCIVEFKTREDVKQAIAFIKNIWPGCLACTLEFKIKNKQNCKDTSKVTDPSPPLSERPRIIIKSSFQSDKSKVIVIRDSIAPPSENSIGFDSGWMERLKLQYIEKIHKPAFEENVSPTLLHDYPNCIANYLESLMIMDKSIISIAPLSNILQNE